MPSSPETTPPHYPLYNIRFSKLEIKHVLSKVLPQVTVTKVEQLASGKSYNNRIYFVTIKEQTNDSNSPDETDLHSSTQNVESRPEIYDLVLKVAGTNFGPEKVQNEVSILLLLHKYCPSVPAPRILAWSEEGRTFQRSVEEPLSDLEMPEADKSRCRGWILMTRRPGRILTQHDLEGTHVQHIMQEIAKHTAQWRQMLRTPELIGNLRLYQTAIEIPRSATSYLALSPLRTSYIDGILMTDTLQPTSPITNAASYYNHKIQDALIKLETKSTYSRIRNAVFKLLEDFTRNELQHLPLLLRETKQPMAFTHYDLSPRNILISEDPITSMPTITGILDFEFAGFFPEEEEFTNTLVNSQGDWPDSAYQMFMEELESLGVQTPAQGIKKDHFEQACTLVKVIEHVAPWWLPGSFTGTELDKEVDKAIEEVEKGIQYLKLVSR